eukprot:285097-Chlamydomonas_euryale.AAC.2
MRWRPCVVITTRAHAVWHAVWHAPRSGIMHRRHAPASCTGICHAPASAMHRHLPCTGICHAPACRYESACCHTPMCGHARARMFICCVAHALPPAHSAAARYVAHALLPAHGASVRLLCCPCAAARAWRPQDEDEDEDVDSGDEGDEANEVGPLIFSYDLNAARYRNGVKEVPQEKVRRQGPLGGWGLRPGTKERRGWQVLAGAGSDWQVLAGASRDWQVLAGAGRDWQGLARAGRCWQLLAGAGSDRKVLAPWVCVWGGSAWAGAHSAHCIVATMAPCVCEATGPPKTPNPPTLPRTLLNPPKP